MKVWFCALLYSCSAFAQSTPDLQRAFAPDRPSSTNTPYTIDPHHLQLEVEAINLSRDQINYPNPNLRIGVGRTSEIDVAWVPLLTQQTQSPPVTAMGDLTLRLKQNIFGDSRQTALALMPSLKIPTNTNQVGNRKFEPTLMVPFACNLPFNFGLNLMPEYDLRKNQNDDAFHSEFTFPVTIGHRLFGSVGEYVEYVIHSNLDQATKDSQTVVTHYLGVGISPKIGEQMQVDLGANIGLNSATVPLAFFAGWVIRR